MVFGALEISANDIAKLCFERFKQLPKTGKPSKNEWTVLAGVVLYNKKTGYSEVISLGCGTKCIGKSKLCSLGLTLNDSHAEVMARRGLLRYLYYQLNKSLEDIGGDHKEFIFEWLPEKQKFHLKNELSLHFLSTQTPCGDACITLSKDTKEFIKEPDSKRKRVDNTDILGSILDTVYTGAKLIGSNHTDAMEQLVGAVRTKPGRGERTLSMSCSDKLAKWQIMGVQGALLDILLSEPIYFSSLNLFGENSLIALERALWKRFQDHNYENSKYRLHIPNIRICGKSEFLHIQEVTKRPSPNGLVWCNIPEDLRPYEISVNGKRQGVTTKKLQTPQSALKISKYFLLREFIKILKTKPDLLPNVNNLENKPYLDLKFLAKDYQSAWSDIKTKYFKQWSQKPESMLKFSVKQIENKGNSQN